MLKYLTKFAMDVLPSVVATILGAYIVNHYINTKSDASAPAAAVVSPFDSKGDGKSVETAKAPQPGVKAKGISERAMLEKSASEGPAEVKPTEVKPTEVKPAEAKPAEAKPTEAKSTDVKPAEVKPAETANAPTEPRRIPLAREKAIAKVTPAPAASPAPSTEAAATPDERRDANDLARAAIERLRNSAANEGGAHPQEPQRTVGVSPVRPLPPPISVSTPSAESYNAPSQSANPPYTASIRNDDPTRPTPPAEIPAPPPLDLRAAAHEATTARDRAKAVAEDMLSAAKSMFHTVLPQ
jgi:hypothetical protein